MNHEVGGLTGGLYQVFEVVGEGCLTILIGSKRAGRPALETNRVVLGGLSTGALLGALVATVAAWSYEISMVGAGIALGLFVGAMAGLVLAGIVIAYVSGVDRELKREEEQRAKEQRFTQIKERRRQEYIGKGMTSEEADRAAETDARKETSGGCFVATACYGSSDAPQVIILKRWRDERLSQSLSGRLFVKGYYLVSPHAVPVVERFPLLRCSCVRILNGVCDLLTQGALSQLQSK
jgi:hypothetical protein